MFKIFLFLLISTFAFASDKVEVYATSMDTNNSIVHANGDVTVIYKDYFLNSKRAQYNKKTGELELFGEIRATQGKNYKVLGDYAKLNISQKERTFQPFYMLEKKSQVWMSGDEGYAKDKDVEIDSGVLSGCNPNDPLWTMEFTSSDYNSESKWLNIYNARIYIYDIPVMYTPYFGYSLDTTRRTGLLTPALGLSSQEGFYYEQPIYIAEQNWWDLELRPQVRTTRGVGSYGTFRFVDSKVSKGEITAGYFKENETYYQEQSLVNDSHYGFNFKYDNTDFLNQWLGTSLEGQSGLYMSLNNMNDVDYINLSSNDATNTVTSNQVLSVTNMFYNNDYNYIGAYFKYYKDLTNTSNEDTLQQLPTLQYHYYLDTFLDNHLIYNLDVQSNNINREVGLSAVQTNINLPVVLQTSLFDEYLNLSYSALLYGQHSSFRGENEETPVVDLEDGIYARNYNFISASTQLTKAYEGVTHVVDFSSSYLFGGSEYREGFYKNKQEFCADADNKDSTECEFYNVSDVEEAIQLGFTEYFYNLSGKELVYHKISQTIGYNNYVSNLGEIENELSITFFENLNLYSDIFYNYDENSLSKSLTSASYGENGFNVSLSYLYKDDFSDSSSSPYTRYMTSSASYTYDEHYSYNVSYNYDLESSLKKSAQIGFLYKKRCWDFGLRYVENNRPVLTTSNSGSVYDRYIYFNIVLKPLMSSGSTSSTLNNKLPDSLKGQ